MVRKDVVYLSVAIAVLIGAGVIYMKLGRGNEKGGQVDFPDGHSYICLACEHVTVLTHAQLMEFKAQAREDQAEDARNVPCAECGSRNTAVAVKCPNCGKYFPRPGGRPVCPHCKEPFPSPLGGGK